MSRQCKRKDCYESFRSVRTQTEETEYILNIKNGERVFEPSIATRSLDTESIGLEYFAKQKGAVKGRKYPDIVGEIKITSDLCPCPSCSAIFQQFSDMFPNVRIKIVTSTKLHY